MIDLVQGEAFGVAAVCGSLATVAAQRFVKFYRAWSRKCPWCEKVRVRSGLCAACKPGAFAAPDDWPVEERAN